MDIKFHLTVENMITLRSSSIESQENVAVGLGVHGPRLRTLAITTECCLQSNLEACFHSNKHFKYPRVPLIR